jgi:hypothetical protein
MIGKVKLSRKRPGVAPEGSRRFRLSDFTTFGTRMW